MRELQHPEPVDRPASGHRLQHPEPVDLDSLVRGQREQGNNFMLDGVDMNDTIDNLTQWSVVYPLHR
jgi:hypothetical protein